MTTLTANPLSAAPRVLVIDDSSSAHEVMAGLLHAEGYELHFAFGGNQGLEMAALLLPQAICCDLMMPEISGLEVCTRLKADAATRHIPIIMVTALDSKEVLAQALAAGADDFVTKPIHSLELRARLRSMVRISRQYHELEEALRLRTDLSHMVVHDLRGPLSGLLLSAEMIRIEPLSPQQSESLTRVELAGERLNQMLFDILAIGQIEAGKLPLRRTLAPLGELFTTALKNFSPLAASRHLKLRNGAAGGAPVEKPISMDRSLVERVIDNLLTNALKFSPAGGTIVLSGGATPEGGGVIEVADEGPGVPSALRERIFEKFEIGELHPQAAQIGLGLAFCKLVAEAHGGRIAVRPNQAGRPGKSAGSVFTFSWQG